MRAHHWIVTTAALGYAALGEAAYRSDRIVRDAYGHCVRAAADYDELSLVVGLAIWLPSAALLALSVDTGWRVRTASGTAVAVLMGAGFGGVWYHLRMRSGAECPLIEFHGWYSGTPGLRVVLMYLGAACVLSIISIPVGYLVRRMRALLAPQA